MATNHNWIHTNIDKRIDDKTIDFDVFLNPYPFTIASFETSCNNVVQLIAEKNKPIYIGLSGGMDSEYVAKCFLRCGVNFFPVLVLNEGNMLEAQYAIHFCKQNNLSLKIINTNRKELFQLYYNLIVRRLGGNGINSTRTILAANYAKQNDGIFLQSEHVLDEGFFSLNEWDFYNDSIFDQDLVQYFFLYTPQIVYSMMKAYDNTDMQEFKFNLFQIPFRPKIKPTLQENEKKIHNKFFAKTKRTFIFPDNLLDKYIEVV